VAADYNIPVPKSDQLGICNNLGIPEEDFRLTFCNRCLSEECTRSQLSQGGAFEQRVRTWHDRLFSDVNKMPPEDPRFQTISAQKFVTIPVGQPLEIRGNWVDPRELQEPVEIGPVASEPSPEPVSVAPPENPKPSLPAEPPSEPVPSPVTVPEKPVMPTQPLQTPGGVGRMVSGGPPKKTSDPWEPVGVSREGTEKIVSPGARIKLGSNT
jgi:hypothetical protein